MAQTLYGLLGWPVGHSVSPPMMNAAFKETGVDAVYVAFAVPTERIRAAVAGLAALGAGGTNVTIPHKQAVFALVHDRTPEAELAGAVNTVRFTEDGNRWIGHNTDVAGWWQSIAGLLADGHRRFAVLGAGGAARAVLAALSLYRPDATATVIARDLDKASALVSAFASRLSVTVAEWDKRHQEIAQADVVVNTTPVGMWPHADVSPIEDASCFAPGQVVQDIVYRPLETVFMRQAKARGATVADGLSMLVYQGAAAFTFWLERPAPAQTMAIAARQALGEGDDGLR